MAKRAKYLAEFQVYVGKRIHVREEKNIYQLSAISFESMSTKDMPRQIPELVNAPLARQMANIADAAGFIRKRFVELASQPGRSSEQVAKRVHDITSIGVALDIIKGVLDSPYPIETYDVKSVLTIKRLEVYLKDQKERIFASDVHSSIVMAFVPIKNSYKHALEIVFIGEDGRFRETVPANQFKILESARKNILELAGLTGMNGANSMAYNTAKGLQHEGGTVLVRIGDRGALYSATGSGLALAGDAP